jgi:starch synthase
MACGTPVVASSVGGIPEVVDDGETGILVPFGDSGPGDGEPKEPHRFSNDLAAAINRLIASPERLKEMALEARRRVEEHFSWKSIARQTFQFYEELLRSP